MLSIKYIRDNYEVIKQNLLKRRNENKVKQLDTLINSDKELRQLQLDLDQIRGRRNQISEDINSKKKAGEDVTNLIDEVKNLPKLIKQKEEQYIILKNKTKKIQMSMPNMLHDSVPYGETDEQNQVIETWGDKKTNEWTKSHVDVINDRDLADLERATKVAGARFYYLKNDLVLLELALLKYGIDKLVEEDYTPLTPPFMTKRHIEEGATDIEEFESTIYKIENEDLYLIPTAEHPILGMHSNEVIPVEMLPIKYVGWSPCFRKEAGSHGKDTKGLFRVHQFNKVEMFVYCKPEDSWELHEKMININKKIMQELNLPYRIVNVCTGDIGIVAAKKYDIEVWMPKQQTYRELISCSNATSYQAVRSNIRFEDRGERKNLHTLNSTVIPTERMMVAIIENYQTETGEIIIPEVLRKYMNGKEKI